MEEIRINTNNAQFVLSAVKNNQYPKSDSDKFDMVDIVFSGKSNVGKSSLLNKLMNRKKLAKVSASPGKTRAINFFDIDKKVFFVDLPGYGYAQRSKSESLAWGNMMEGYFKSERSISLIVQLVDIRHKPTKDDIQMIEYLKYYKFDFIIAATKLDKIKKSQVDDCLQTIRQTLDLPDNVQIIPCSSEKGEGIAEIMDIIKNKIKVKEKPEGDTDE